MLQDYFSNSATSITSPIEGQVFSVPSSGISVAPIGAADTIDETMPALESNSAIQGGDLCLRGSRITIQGIVEAMMAGRTFGEIVFTLEKHFRYKTTQKELQRALLEYERRVGKISV